MMSFKGKHFPKDVILFAVYFYLRYPVSYQDLQEIMEERGVDVDDARERAILWGVSSAVTSGGDMKLQDEVFCKAETGRL